MCGIVGSVRFDGSPIDKNTIIAMQQSLKHRGPDGDGIWKLVNEPISVTFAHNRLAIIDLTETGQQPMLSPDGSYCITYNGEIYNYIELRKELESLGHNFISQSDTEVLLISYIQWGINCLGRFNGMFAFAIWDNHNKILFCARDRLGIKPFFYTIIKDVFYFASEVKALLNIPGINSNPDNISIYDYLSLGLMHHSERTFFAEIKQLTAGSYMLVDKSGQEIKRYWMLPSANLGDISELDILELQTLLHDTVQLRLRSDVPVGVLLSGGLDSSSITAIASQHHNGSIKAFSLEFNNPGSDESKYARLISSHCNADLILLRPKGIGLWNELDTLIRAQDAPTHAPEIYSNWCMMRAVSECGIKVLLSGQGGDELFGGYNWYPKYFLSSLLRSRKLITFLNEFIKLPRNFPTDSTKNHIILLAWLFYSFIPLSVRTKIKPELKGIQAILKGEFRKKMLDRDRLNLSLVDPSRFENKMYNDLLYNNIPLYLHYEDANAMAFSIEERVPMLDHRIVEWAQKLAIQWKIRDGISKYSLRKSMNNILPEKICTRKDKMGLSAPKDSWFRNELKTNITELFSGDCRLYENWINKKELFKQLELYLNRHNTPIYRLLWRLINLEKWFCCYS